MTWYNQVEVILYTIVFAYHVHFSRSELYLNSTTLERVIFTPSPKILYCAGFGEHPHREVEICTYVVDGELTHQDSMGTAETLSRGAIQFMVKSVRQYDPIRSKFTPTHLLY